MTTKSEGQQKAKKYNIVKTFTLECVSAPPQAEIEGKDKPGQFTPAMDPDYEFRKELLTDIMAWWQLGDGEPLYLAGPAGSGKSSVVRQIVSMLNLNLQHVVGHDRLEFPELATTIHILNGNTRVLLGPLALAMKFGMVFLFDEVDLVSPSTNAALNEVLQGRPLTIPETGEVIVPHERFRFIASGNSNGRDMTGLYQGVVEQNPAFMDRFWVLNVDYPTPDVELRILQKANPDAPKEQHEGMIEIANDVRAAFMGVNQSGQACEVTFSTRTLKRWDKVTHYFRPLATQGILPLEYALERVLLNRATPDTASFIRGLVQRKFGGQP